MNVVGRKRREGVVNGIGGGSGVVAVVRGGSSGSGKWRGFVYVGEDREF